VYNVFGDKMKIYLIRHGETDANSKAIIQGRTDNPLNQNGRHQAVLTAKHLKQLNISFDYCVASPLSRAIDTLEIIKRELNLQIETVIEESIIEREFGALDGKKITDDYYQTVHEGHVDGLEKDAEIEDRVKQYFLQFFLEHNHQNVLMVAHSHVIKALLVQYIDDFDYDHYLNNCSINIMTYDDDIKIIEYNINPL